MYQKQVAVIIPAYNPDEKLYILLKNLFSAGFHYIIIVDDGSRHEIQFCFDKIHQDYPHIPIIKHSVNLGKGRALKSAFNEVLNRWPHCVGAVTVDADGQHTAEDTVRCATMLIEHPDSLVLGCRKFAEGTIPLRSRIGNILTCHVTRLLCGIKVSDTQTGLRAISREHMKLFMNTKGERFEYEMNLLLETKEHNIPILEVPIQTIYIDQNETSHFHPLRDSLQIYGIFLKFIAASLSSFIIDISLFTLFVMILKPLSEGYYIYISTIGARLVSLLFNFLINKKSVFKNRERTKITFVKYVSLCILQLTVSAFSVNLLVGLIQWQETVVKMIVDSVLFLLSFQIQREWVFREKRL